MRLLSRRTSVLRLRPPDYVEERRDLVLLIWGDLPFWTVVDREFHNLLRGLDGARRIEAVIDARPAWRAMREEILQQIASLRASGVFSKTPPPPLPGAPLYGTKIENVALNLTNRCNLRCRFCYNLPRQGAGSDRELPAAEITGFLKTLRPFLGKQATLTVLGGEPLLEPEKLFAVAEAAVRQRMTVLVSTNGLLVDAGIAARARRIGMQVQVSLDGHAAELHDAIRGAGAFARTLAGVRALVAEGAHAILSLVCHRGNLPFLADYLRLARELGVAEARFIPLKRLGAADDSGLEPVPLDELLLAALHAVQAHPEFLPLLRTDALSILAGACRYSVRRASCGTGLQTVLLDADGSLYPCLNTTHPAFNLGNLRDPGFDFRRLWLHSARLREIREGALIGHAGDGHAGCPVRYWCLGGCRGENHALTGGLNRRPPHCTELRRGIIAMCWMLAECPELGSRATPRC